MTSVTLDVSLQHLISERGLVPHYMKVQDAMPEQTVVRERFINRREFVLTFIGYVVGPHNVWRFPYLVMKNKGGVFVLLYILVTILIGLPVSYLELALGQFSGKNTIHVWDLSPAFRGVGFSFIIVCWLTSLNFHVVMAHCLLYSFHAIGHSLPWTICRPEWKNCFVEVSELRNWTESNNVSGSIECSLEQLDSRQDCGCHGSRVSHPNCAFILRSASEFFYMEDILGTQKNSVEVTEFGTPNWRVALVLLVSWALVILCVLRGIRYTTRFLYVLVLLPFAFLLILLGQRLSQEGAISGLEFLFKVDTAELAHFRIWVDAISQAFFSINTILGELFIIGSYMDFHNQYLHWDLLIVSATDVTTSILYAMLICLTLGITSHVAGSNHEIEDFVTSDLGISFTTYPAMLVSIPGRHLMSAVFFVMLYTLAIDTEFGLVETVLTYLQDDFRIIRRNTMKSRILFGVFCYLISLVLICPGGNSIVKLIDVAVYSTCLPILGLIEVCVIMWAYGVGRFLSDMEYMLSIKLRCYNYVIFHLAIFLPISLICLVMGSNVQDHDHPIKEVVVVLLILIPVPLWFTLYARKIYNQYPSFTLKKKWRRLLQPRRFWVPNDGSNIRRRTHSVFTELLLLPKSADNLATKVQSDDKWVGDRLFDSLFMVGGRPGMNVGARTLSLSHLETLQRSQVGSSSQGPEKSRRRHTMPCDFRVGEFSSSEAAQGPSGSTV